jgi:hypothetical protein
MRDWRLFFLKQPSRPMPAWVNQLTWYLWLAAIPWVIETVKDFLRDHSQNPQAAWFVIGFLAFCFLISLAAKYLPPDKKALPANLEKHSG